MKKHQQRNKVIFKQVYYIVFIDETGIEKMTDLLGQLTHWSK